MKLDTLLLVVACAMFIIGMIRSSYLYYKYWMRLNGFLPGDVEIDPFIAKSISIITAFSLAIYIQSSSAALSVEAPFGFLPYAVIIFCIVASPFVCNLAARHHRLLYNACRPRDSAADDAYEELFCVKKKKRSN
jgi:hypothetical protein